MNVDKQIVPLIYEMREHFVVPAPDEEIFASLDVPATSLAPNYKSVVEAFRHNLSGTLSTVAMPFALAQSSVQRSHYQRFHTAQRILAELIKEDDLKEGEEIETVRNREARSKANAEMDDFSRSEEGRNVVIGDICAFLMNGVKNGLDAAAQELVLQGMVLLWSAFEVLCRDVFEALLNENPQLVQTLMNHPDTRKRFEAERLPLDTLINHNFNLSARLGTVLVSQQDFSNLRTIKAVYAVLFPSSTELREALEIRELWMLFQRRHLVVHRRGVIDRAYVDATGDAGVVGTRLVVKPRTLEDGLKFVVSAGGHLAQVLPKQDVA